VYLCKSDKIKELFTKIRLREDEKIQIEFEECGEDWSSLPRSVYDVLFLQG